MNEQTYIDHLFAKYKDIPEIRDFKEEITVNLRERIKDFAGKGMSDEEAFKEATAELGDITQIADNIIAQKRNAKLPVSGKKIYNEIMISLYGIALLTCFICNLSVDKTLSWFFIVLCSVGIAFCITTLPFMLKKFRVILPTLLAVWLIYMLLFICNWYAQGDWLYTMAYPIATFSVAYLLLTLLVVMVKKVNWYFKSAVISLMTGVFVSAINPWVNYVLEEKANSFIYYLNSDLHRLSQNNSINILVSLLFFAYFIVGTILGVVHMVGNSRRR